MATVAFYNLENLFDFENDKLTFDDDYTANGKNNWTEDRFKFKLKKLANTIAEIGRSNTNMAPVLLGVAEVENRLVLEMLVDQNALREADYGIAHFDSPDRRGIDVALLYDRRFFKLTKAQKHTLLLNNDSNERIYTRDQLCVSGYLGDELIYCIVNHWPSRRGGQKRSESKRIEAAKLTKKICDSVYHITKDAKIIVMGDFNDNPTDKSFKSILNSKSVPKGEFNYLYNPMEAMFKKGLGSLGYRDQWSLFDQILVSKKLLDTLNWNLWQTHIYNPNKLRQKKGKYKGYPIRTFSGGKYNGGYSDHFPVYIYLIKKITQ